MKDQKLRKEAAVMSKNRDSGEISVKILTQEEILARYPGNYGHQLTPWNLIL